MKKLIQKIISIFKKKKTSRFIALRTLTVGDFDKFSDLIEDLVSKTGNDALKKIIDSTREEKQADSEDSESKPKDVEIAVVVEVGMNIISKLRKFMKEEASEFFAYLLNKTIDEYKAMPIDTPILILKAIRTAPEAETFFTMQSLPSSMTGLSDLALGKAKEKLDFILAEMKKNS